MANKISLLMIAFIAFLFSGCAKQAEPYDYTNLLKERPKSILVLMPTNETVEPKGSSAVLAGVTAPLSEAGYYVFPVAFVHETFKANGLNEADEISRIPLAKINQIFAPDAVMYINIKNYGTSYQVLQSTTGVVMDIKLVGTRSGNTLWERNVVYQENSGNGGGIIGMLINAAVTQIANSIKDRSFDAALIADNIAFASDCNICILRGAKSPNYGKDKQLNSAK